MNFLINTAYAVGEGADAVATKGSGLSTLLLFGGIFVLFYVLIIRPQNKRAKTHRNMVSTLSLGDEVITTGGILGKIVAVDEAYFRVEIAPGTTVILQKSYITASLPKGTYKAMDS